MKKPWLGQRQTRKGWAQPSDGREACDVAEAMSVLGAVRLKLQAITFDEQVVTGDL